MTDQTSSWVERAGHIADKLAVDALERDRAGADPLAEVELLRDAELPGLTVPASFGGPGAGWDTALAVVRRIAQADGSIAQLLGYHYVNVSNLWTADPDTAEPFARESLAGQWLWGDSVNPIDPDLTLRTDGSGYRLDGTKSFSTGASVGDAVLAAGTVEDTGEPLLVVVRRGAPGLGFNGAWDSLGQRLSASGAAVFTDVDIPADHVIGSLAADAVTPRSSLITPAIQTMFGHLYLGIAEGALSTARDYTRESTRPWVLSGLQSALEDPYILSTYGELAARLAAVSALAERQAAALTRAAARGPALTWEERGELAVDVAALKVVSTDTALEVTSRIFEVTGARSAGTQHGFDRFWRNVRTHTLHDPVAWKRREVGLHYLTGEVPEFTLYT